MLIHGRLNATIKLHKSIHGFQTQQGTRTAIMQVKLLMQKVQQDSNPMYMIFLDLQKAYNSINLSCILQLLQQYGVGPNMLCIIENIWVHDTVIPQKIRFYGRTFKAERGVRQGDILSPTLFKHFRTRHPQDITIIQEERL
jgi:Reverse transcriptase (RNA-dependent DNA polymerase)